MKTEYNNCVDHNTAIEYFIEHREMPLHLPEEFELWIECKIKQNEHSEDYISQRIKLVKYLYCKHAKSDILRAYSRDRVRVKNGKLTDEEEKEAIRIIKEAKELLNKKRDTDKYHHEGTHYWENRIILNDYVIYLSAMYQIPKCIMDDDYKQRKWWEFWKELP